MYRKFYRVLRVAALVSVIFAAWALGLNQLSSALENGHDLQVRSAVEQCVQFDMPKALIVDGKVFCNGLYMGTDYVIPLDKLQKMKKD